MNLFTRSVEFKDSLLTVQAAVRQRFVHIVGRFVLFGVVTSFGNGFLYGVTAGFGAIEAYVQLLGFGAPFGGRNASNRLGCSFNPLFAHLAIS